MNGPRDSYSLDVFGQRPELDIYTPICSCFPLTDTSSHSTIINTLTHGLERLSANFPWVTGQIVNEGASDANSGIFTIKPLEKIPRLVVKDLRDDPSMPTMDIIRRANFPFSMLDESIIAPRRSFPGSDHESASDSKPVFLLQATFITGGILLTFLGQHQAMDMTGQGQIMHLLSKACRNEQFTTEELSSGNLIRHNLIPLFDDSYKQGDELAHQTVKPTPSKPISDNHDIAPPNCTWAYFIFSPTSLILLKSFATKSIMLSSGYTTDDVLTAFIWQSIIRARLPRLNPTADSTLARAVDSRRYLNIPQTYTGVVHTMAYHTYQLQELADEPLGRIASQLRSAVDPKTSDIGYRTRALATLLNRSPVKNVISVRATLDSTIDITISSWTKVNCYELDFNLGLGKPEAVRRPQFVPLEGLILFMPKALDGEIAVGICLRDEDMKRLRADQEFAKYGKYIG